MPVLAACAPEQAEKLRRTGQSPPEPFLVDALIDTAADCSVVQSEVADRLEIDPIRRRRVRTPTTGRESHTRNVYAISILLVHPQRNYHFSAPVEVIESSLGHGDCEMLLGRDVLGNCLFILDGAVRFTIAF